jgi:23S rRNA (cytosine1962-C5)-methyltransferase
MSSITLKRGRDKSVMRRHPWIFAGGIAEVAGDPAPGETVSVYADDGAVLGQGAWSPQSQISVRMWHFDDETTVDPDFLRERLQRALALRRQLYGDAADVAYRLVNAESDGIPGLVVDRYADVLVCQFLSVGADRWRQAFVDLLVELTDTASIYERSDVDVRRKEGLEPRTGLLYGDEPPEHVTIREGEIRYLVDVRTGHKTGFYLDQRDARAVVPAYLRGEVLNCFAYTGAFAVAALRGGADHVTNIDSSADAIAMGNRHLELNGLPADALEPMVGDVFHQLRRFRDSRRDFDGIILDPPKFAESKEKVNGACRGYKDINLLAMKLLRPGGTLVTFSCSGLITPALFERTVAFAASDAGRDVQVLRRLDQAADHPSTLQFPEANYLKGLICRVL